MATPSDHPAPQDPRRRLLAGLRWAGWALAAYGWHHSPTPYGPGAAEFGLPPGAPPAPDRHPRQRRPRRPPRPAEGGVDMTETIEPTATAADWVTCGRCSALLYAKRFRRDLGVCSECGHHSRLTAPERLAQLLDEGSATVLTSPHPPEDPLGFADLRPYADRLREARADTGMDDALLQATGTIEGHPVVVCVLDFAFMGGSLGTAVGEGIADAAETALRTRTPLVLVTASGGARMQEGVLSLLQMAKTSQALAALDRAGVLTVSVITDPTYGGVAASFATLADVIVAEPGARMGFAGPRVIAQTIGQSLPEGFQTAEFLLGKGLVDDVRPRAELRSTLAGLVRAARPDRGSEPGPDTLIRRFEDLPERDAWESVRAARHESRPTALDYVSHLLDGFQELHGDRIAGDCPAIVGGMGLLDGRTVMVIGHQKGHTTRERVARNFGMPTPDGYRKAARLMRLAAKLRIPVVTLIDTPGAYPGMEAEERGQAVAIAESIRLMSQLPVPVVSVVTGEGGSGGALALGVADRVLCLASAVYSVISPEGCAAILWRDGTMAQDAAAALRLDARELLRMGAVDAVVPEPGEGAHTDPVAAADLLHEALRTALAELDGRSEDELLHERGQRFRDIGRNPIRRSAR
ncbi:acetyl-CoA carboxylase carboxyltransferase subunit alpha [Nocardiopsis sp. NPDC049922]|uniref:acetyl-CoA carboxylase carboxyltransferase subunit alpha n=1 Tax=Nocardiopsis sp. NPDC049922 TaxID=3155157 RepID=UPI00340815B8